MKAKNDRRYVRGAMSLEVNYRTVSREVCETAAQTAEPLQKQDVSGQSPTDSGGAWIANGSTDDSMVAFLLHLNAKLDQILTIVAKDRDNAGLLNKAIGAEISGSGMKLVTAKPIRTGEIIQASFVLSQSPFVFMSVHGEVVNAKVVTTNDEKRYHLGVKFLNLCTQDREQIITSVFQSQRQALRRRKDRDDE